ncbi:autotransporter domain-containing protein [Aeromonas enteropelogenes]|uniref:autotransporter domain-containing protein n=1 Tax=Aeromonas enteropelogenes TaxID=29489 RepID=UPI003BA2C0A3
MCPATPMNSVCKSTLRVGPVALAVLLHCLPAQADPAGRLIFLGWTSDQRHSVWLSAVSSGQFEVESAKQGQVYDSWSQDRRGLHLTLSPEVQNGGTHKLYAYLDTTTGKRVLLDTDNQQGGHFTFPSDFTPPSLPTRPLPPIAVLPPESGVTPPFAPVPPHGVTPGLPGGVTPPVGTLPPQGMMPTRPGGVTPPMGTLPPQGMMPTRPGGVQPPTGLLPTPVLPVVGHPAGEVASTRAWTGTRLCVMGDERAQLPPTLRDRYPDCPSSRETAVAVVQPEPRRWALWGDEVYYDVADHREGNDLSGSTNVFTLGAETRLDQAMSLGVAVSRLDSKVTAFEGGMRLVAGGYNLGPYLTYRLSERWMLDAALMYGWMDNEQGLLFLSGDYGSTSVSGNLGGSAQFEWDAFTLRPRLALSYSHTCSDGYRLQGDYRGLPLQLERGSDSYNQGNLTGTLELSRLYHTRDGVPVMPYGELGLDYGFERPNDGYILTGNLDMARTQPLSGTIRVGLRALLGGATTVTASTGYLSLGQGGLSVWEWRLNLSKSF